MTHVESVIPVAPTEGGDLGDASHLSKVDGNMGDGKFESVSSMADLKEKAPEVYRAMIQGIGMNICNEMRKHQRRLKEIMRKARNGQ